VLGLVDFARRPEAAEASGPPGWLGAYVGLPILVKVIGGTPNPDLGAWTLVPVCALGLAGFVERLPEARRLVVLLALAGVQLLLNFGFQAMLGMGDPTREWSARAGKMQFQAQDVVITRDQMHEYLLRHRHGVRTINLRVPVELEPEAQADWWSAARELLQDRARAGGRVVVDWMVGEPLAGTRDYPYLAELHELVLLAPVVHLDPRAEKREDVGELDEPVILEADKSELPAALRKR
jgi:hypothetical protein